MNKMSRRSVINHSYINVQLANIQLFHLLDMKFRLITEAKATRRHTHSSSDISYFDEKSEQL